MAGMQVVGLWRYPVKSLQGERLEAAEVTVDGLAGDRRFAIFDTATGLGLTGRRMPELLFAAARSRADGSVQITLPDGSVADDDAALSRWLGRPVHLRSVDEAGARRVREPRGHGARGAVAGVHRSAGAVPRLVLDPGLAGVHDHAGSRIHAGSGPTCCWMAMGRTPSWARSSTWAEPCWTSASASVGTSMTTRPQPGGIEADPGVLRTIARERDACLAIGALVAGPGTVRIGDSLGRLRPTPVAG